MPPFASSIISLFCGGNWNDGSRPLNRRPPSVAAADERYDAEGQMEGAERRWGNPDLAGGKGGAGSGDCQSKESSKCTSGEIVRNSPAPNPPLGPELAFRIARNTLNRRRASG